MPAEEYSYRTEWSDEDEEFVSTSPEFPGLSWLDQDRDRALEGMKALVGDVLTDMKETGETPPVPQGRPGA